MFSRDRGARATDILCWSNTYIILYLSFFSCFFLSFFLGPRRVKGGRIKGGEKGGGDLLMGIFFHDVYVYMNL